MKLVDVAEKYCYENILSPDTISTYKRRAKAFDDRMHYDNLKALTCDSGYEFRDKLIAEGLRNTTVNNYMRHCRVIWDFAVQRGLTSVEENIFDIRRLKETRLNKLISENTISMALDALPSRNRWFWEAVITLQAELGIRNRQLVNIQFGDLNFKTRVIYLRAEGNKVGRENILPISDRVERLLETYLYFSEVAIGRHLRNDEYLFYVSRYDNSYAPKSNRRMSRVQLQGAYSRISKLIYSQTGERISGHRLRHTLATRIGSDDNVNIRVIQEWFGWSCIQTAQQYIKVSVDQKRALVDRLPPNFKMWREVEADEASQEDLDKTNELLEALSTLLTKNKQSK